MIHSKEYSRFKWSHDLTLHRWLVQVYNRLMRLIPFGLKYGIGKQIRKNNPPYFLVHEGSTVVQVGAPRDTLHSGRSRGMYFCLFAGTTGKVVLLEPDVDSVRDFEAVAVKNNISNFVLVPKAAWSSNRLLRVFVNDSHPASSFVEGTKSYSAERLQGFRAVELPADIPDNILNEKGIEKVELVSITTNGSEKEILRGLLKTIARGLPYIALARTGEQYIEMMKTLGYDLYSFDDRGFTFKQSIILDEAKLGSQL